MLLLLIGLQAIPYRNYTTQAYPPILWVRLDALMWGCLIYQFSCSSLYRKLEPTFCRFRIVRPTDQRPANLLLDRNSKGDPGSVWLGNKVESQIALVSAALVFLASFDRGYVLPLPGRFKSILDWIGERSYGLYLIHTLLMFAVHESWLKWFSDYAANPHYVYAVAIALLLPTLAELNFLILESPMRRVGVRLAGRILDRSESSSLSR